jgi:hypothetical protein
MTNTATAIPVSQNENVIKIISFLKDNGMAKETQEFEGLVNHFDSMETQFGKLFEDMQGIKSQLQAIEDKSLHGVVSRITEAAGLKVIEVKAHFANTKESFLKSCANAVKVIKEKGISAFAKTMDFLRVKTALTSLKVKLDGAITSMKKTVFRLDAVKCELYEAKTHKHRAKRAFFGKETKKMPDYDSNRGFLAGIQKLMIKASGVLTEIERKNDSAIEGLGKLEQRTERDSVKGEIGGIKASVMSIAEKDAAEVSER